MADAAGSLKAPFPPPPPFYKSFTKQNLAQLRRLRKAAHADTDPIPPELRHLLPPATPIDDWTSYGTTLSLHPPEPSLSESGVQQLYPAAPANPQPHLLALTRSLLTTFLALTGVLSANAPLHAEKVDDLRTICFNLHALINSYRPHQARESLILLMEERVRRLRDEVRRVRESREKVKEMMGGLVGVGGQVGGEEVEGRESGGRVGEVGWMRRQRRGWEGIGREVGVGGLGA